MLQEHKHGNRTYDRLLVVDYPCIFVLDKGRIQICSYFISSLAEYQYSFFGIDYKYFAKLFRHKRQRFLQFLCNLSCTTTKLIKMSR